MGTERTKAKSRCELMHDTFALERFVEAQSAIYPRVVEELSAGRKRSH
jgi:uncharacterized protein (DUF1810 family)